MNPQARLNCAQGCLAQRGIENGQPGLDGNGQG